jgi:hypothetical protein
MIFAEVCAGMAAVSFALQGVGRPPITRPGIKTGYTDAVLKAFDLVPGQGADAYLWLDADPFVRKVLEAYADPAQLTSSAEDLRVFVGAQASHEHAWRSLLKKPDRSIAEEVFVRGNSWKAEGKHWKRPKDITWAANLTAARVSQRLQQIAEAGWVTHVGPDARVFVDFDASEWCVYIDGTYCKTTKYAFNLPREDVVAIARWWYAHGARVVVSEAEPVADLGWPAHDITAGRTGQVRRWSKQQAEWLTCSPRT